MKKVRDSHDETRGQIRSTRKINSSILMQPSCKAAVVMVRSGFGLHRQLSAILRTVFIQGVHRVPSSRKSGRQIYCKRNIWSDSTQARNSYVANANVLHYSRSQRIWSNSKHPTCERQAIGLLRLVLHRSCRVYVLCTHPFALM